MNRDVGLVSDPTYGLESNIRKNSKPLSNNTLMS
jgi:hypothetical protein